MHPCFIYFHRYLRLYFSGSPSTEVTITRQGNFSRSPSSFVEEINVFQGFYSLSKSEDFIELEPVPPSVQDS